MTTMLKKAKLEALKKRKKQLEEIISKCMDIDLNDAADVASEELKVVNSKIEELEAEVE